MQSNYPFIIEPYVGIEDAAKFLRIAVGTLYNWCSTYRETEDSIPYVGKGNKSSFRLSELDSWFRRNFGSKSVREKEYQKSLEQARKTVKSRPYKKATQ